MLGVEYSTGWQHRYLKYSLRSNAQADFHRNKGHFHRMIYLVKVSEFTWNKANVWAVFVGTVLYEGGTAGTPWPC